MTRTNILGTALVMVIGAAGIGCSGSPGRADADADGRPDAVDLCPSTGEQAVAGPDGCTAGEDGDADGLATGDDLCPGTPPGTAVDAFGCSAEQRDAGIGQGVFGGMPAAGGDERGGEAKGADGRSEDDGAAPSSEGARTGDAADDSAEDLARAARDAAQSEELLEHPPETGSQTNGFVALVIDRDSDRPLVFYTFASNVQELDNGYAVHGALLLTTPLGQMPIANASVVFEYGDDRSRGLERLRGDVSVPFPNFGSMQGFEVGDLVKAAIGWDYGKNLTDQAAPILDDRKYLFFDYQQAFEAKSGPVTLSLPGAADATLILDPFDPMLFARGSLLGLSAFGGVDDVSIGISAQGRLPFKPGASSIAGHALDGFNGELYLSGSVPLQRLPFTVSGDLVLDIDPNSDGRPLADIDQAGLELGVNGELSLTASFLDLLSFEAPIEHATADVRITGDDQSAYFSGELDPDKSYLPDELPLRAQERVAITGYLSSTLEDSYLAMEGEYRLIGSSLAKKVGIDLSDLAVAKARLDVDHRGFRLKGELHAGVTLAQDLEIGGGARVEAFFADDPSDFYVTLDGDVSVAGQRLFDASVRIDQDGLFVEGAVDTGVSRVAVSGFITSQGAELEGQAEATIDVQAGKEIVETVTDGAICGYEVVRDGAVCGYEKVTDGAVCGYEKVTDGAVCGYQTVTDGAVCGYQTVTDAAKCGTDTITDGVRCGTHEVCEWLGAIGIHVCDDSPNTCQVAKSCTDFSLPKTCTDFNLPKTCDDVSKPKTCADLTRPKTCEDLARPRTCEHHSIIPDYDYGTVEAKIALRVGTNGIGGDVSGNYCTPGGDCTKLAGGSVKVGASFHACIDVPPNLGEFCAKF